MDALDAIMAAGLASGRIQIIPVGFDKDTQEGEGDDE